MANLITSPFWFLPFKTVVFTMNHLLTIENMIFGSKWFFVRAPLKELFQQAVLQKSHHDMNLNLMSPNVFWQSLCIVANLDLFWPLCWLKNWFCWQSNHHLLIQSRLYFEIFSADKSSGLLHLFLKKLKVISLS